MHRCRQERQFRQWDQGIIGKSQGVTGIGIYGKGILEVLYRGGDLGINQITQMTSGDVSAAAMSNSENSYGVW
jgi:hypothetical protein